MARQTWMGVGVAALGMALVLGAEPGVAQDSMQGSDTSQRTQASGMASSTTASTASSSVTEAEARLQVAELRTQVAQLRQQVAQLREQLAQASSSSTSSAGQGVGGSGTAGTASSTSSSGDSGFDLANILHTGRVRSVSRQQLVLDEEKGASLPLSLANTVEVVQDGRPVGLGLLQEGTRVRTSANLTAPGNPVERIEILPSK